MAERYFKSVPDSQVSSAFLAENITPNDDTDLSFVTREIRVITAGTLKYAPYHNKTSPVTITLLAGEKIALCAHRIYSTGTTCTGILVLY